MTETGGTYSGEQARKEKWDRRFLEMAKLIASWSKDPSTKTGAVIVDTDNRVVSVGYNGFAKGIDDSPERYNDRELKYKLIVHCERNAILFANKSCKGCTLYTYPFMSCSVCAAMVIQSGITRCVAPECPEHLLERWKDDLDLSKSMFMETYVILDLYKE
jgi:dCMP deaminase